MKNIDKHYKMMELYKNDNRVVNWILQFFDVKRQGVVRARAFQDKTRRIYYRYGWALQENLVGLEKTYFLQQVDNAKAAIFYYEYIFNNRVSQWDVKKESHNDNIVGITMTFEIDVPIKGVNIFSDRYWDDFMFQKYKIEKELERQGEEWNCLFSGNGIYIICESRYIDEEGIRKLQELRDIRKRIIDRLTLTSSNGGIFGRPVIDARDLGWANYFKAPFTYHETIDRFTFPIKKGNIDRKWLQSICDINSIDKDKIIEILNECKWRKIW